MIEAVLVRLPRFVVQCAQQTLIRCGKFLKDSQCPVRLRLRLGEHESEELVAGEAARLVKNGCVQVFRQRDRRALPRVVIVYVQRLEGRQIELKVADDSGALALVPAVGQQDPAHIKEDHVEGEDRRLQCALAPCLVMPA